MVHTVTSMKGYVPVHTMVQYVTVFTGTYCDILSQYVTVAYAWHKKAEKTNGVARQIQPDLNEIMVCDGTY